jgi:hypothetical protein
MPDQPVARQAGGTKPALWWMAMALAAAAMLAPLFLVDVPPLLDYPNHLARLFVLSAVPGDAVLGRMYAPDWHILPNLAIDLIFPPLMHLLSVHTVGRVLLGFILLLNLAGIAAYHRAVFGSVSLWTSAAALAGINGVFLLGFLNYEVSQGLAFLAAAGWICLHQRRPLAAALFGVAVIPALFFSHLMGAMLFLLLIGSAEVALLWLRLFRTGRWVALLRAAAMVLPPAAAGAALYAAAPLSDVTESPVWMPLKGKLAMLLMPFQNGYALWFDILTAAAVAGFLLGCLLARRGRIAPKAVAAFTIIAVLYPLAPSAYNGVGFPDLRLPVMLGFLLFAGFRPARLGRLAGWIAVAGFGTLLLARAALVSVVWHAHAGDLADLRQVLAAVSPGDRVASITLPNSKVPGRYDIGTRDFPDHWRNVARRHLGTGDYDPHIAALAVIERRAFWPLLFSDPTQQPIRMQPGYDLLKARGLPEYVDLVALRHGEGPLVGAPNPFCGFDHLLALVGGADPAARSLAPAWLKMESRTDTAVLYRVSGCPGVPGAGG